VHVKDSQHDAPYLGNNIIILFVIRDRTPQSFACIKVTHVQNAGMWGSTC